MATGLRWNLRAQRLVCVVGLVGQVGHGLVELRAHGLVEPAQVGGSADLGNQVVGTLANLLQALDLGCASLAAGDGLHGLGQLTVSLV